MRESRKRKRQSARNTKDEPPKKKPTKKRPSKPQAIPIRGGKLNKGGDLMYFSVDGAIRGDSPGMLCKNSHLLQYINLYKKDKNYLPPSITNQVK